MPQIEVTPKVLNQLSVEPVNFGVIRVKEILNGKSSFQMSVSLIELDGDNELGRNTKSDAVYFVLEGSGSFTIGNGERLDVYNVEKGSLIFIPRGVLYKDTGRMRLLAINTPSYDPEARGFGEPGEMESNGVIIGAKYEHCVGGQYRVLSVDLDATHWEETEEVKPVVRYEQLYQGKFPPGTVWVRDLVDFLGTREKDGKQKFTQATGSNVVR